MRDLLARRRFDDPHPGTFLERCLPLARNAPANVPDRRGRASDEEKKAHVERMAEFQVGNWYETVFERWKQHVLAGASWTCQVEASSRLLIGAGNASPLEIGIAIHHTYGVPYLPGSALKGVLNHWFDERGGGAYWKGVTYSNGRPAAAPGAHHAIVFGAPEIVGDDGAAGLVAFDDALYVPGSAPERKPWAVDVLTPHQKPYYDGQGAEPPTDWYPPSPHPFVSVRPGVRFLLSVSGPHRWAELALRNLLDVLAERGVGAKTSAGYGRLKLHREIAAPPPTEAELELIRQEEMTVEASLLEDPTFQPLLEDGAWLEPVQAITRLKDWLQLQHQERALRALVIVVQRRRDILAGFSANASQAPRAVRRFFEQRLRPLL
jgi:CRISPR-associated protein Cmr6